MALRSQLLKGVLDACVMAVVEEQPVYGYELSQKLQKIGLPNISDGTIYPVLLRLQKNGFIKGEMKPSATGPNRKYYFLTDEGKEELEQISAEWLQIADPVSKLLKRSEKDEKSNGAN
ncbi:PadR family transcriptional regulator [Planococcus donghaensis MPA1U2]|uniref:PadR family transcriptional regulator n=1 Tax=Planococcus donghaensis MPA1U2 TaxID=933115 RepID=E7RHM8_9BACL|nr:PadR family transcriptional regulator [Planococcus donghaensis]EGA89472.1 PadR family transcriptional regulator [Planococcus donghaensis MPA1U2]